MLNDKTYGGVFVSHDGGTTWQQQSNGLDGYDVFSLAQAADGSLFAGTNHGIYRWNGSAWTEDNKVVTYVDETRTTIVKKKRVKVTRTRVKPDKDLTSRVNAVDVSGDVWYAATVSGVYRSTDKGATWTGGPVEHNSDFLFVSAKGPVAIAAGRQNIAVSEDEGKTWKTVSLPSKLTTVQALATAGNGSLWIGGREGVFYSDDHGQNWQALDRLPASDITGLNYDSELKRLIITSRNTTLVFAVNDADKTWKWWDSGWNLHSVTFSGNRLAGASLFDGVVMQPGSEAVSTVAGR